MWKALRLRAEQCESESECGRRFASERSVKQRKSGEMTIKINKKTIAKFVGLDVLLEI